MATYTDNVINISLLRQYKNSFSQEKDKFNNTAYKTFSSSYLKTCSDSNIKRISNKLDSIYRIIEKGYSSIEKWWREYNDNVECLENSLSNGNLRGITKGSLRSFVASNLVELNDYKSNLSGTFNNKAANFFSASFSNNTVSAISSFTSVDNVSKSISSKEVSSSVSKINTIDLINEVGTAFSTTSSRINKWVDNTIEDVSDFFEETKAKVTEFGNNVKSRVDEVVENSKQSLINTFAYISNKVKNLWNRFVNWISDKLLPWLENASGTIKEVLKSTAATVGTFTISLLEGIGQFGEAIIDFAVLVGTAVASIATGLYDGGQAIYGLITGNEWESVTKQMWNLTKGFVSKDYVTSWFDSLYADTKVGKWLSENAYFYDTTRSIGSGLGYVAGVVILSIATFGIGGTAITTATGVELSSATYMSVISGLAGVGKGTQNAWADGADIGNGLIAGALSGVWEGVQFYIGSKIGNSKIFGSDKIKAKLLNPLSRVILDGVDGGAEGFVQPLINAIYKDGYTDENGNYIEFIDGQNGPLERYFKSFDAAGGLKNVVIQTAIGAGGSMVGEVFDLAKLLRNKVPNNKTVTNVEVVESISENIENNIKKLYNDKLSLKKTMGGLVASPLNMFSRFKNVDVTDNIEISNKVLNDGLYHFTSFDSATKILESGYVKESDFFVSYGKKKSFFFAGIPTVEDLAVNVRGLEPKRIAVKFDVDADNLINFKYRKFADNAISYEGRYKFDKSKASIVYLGLFEENGNLVYKELPKVDFDNYKCDISNAKLNTLVNRCKSTMLGMARESDYFMDNVKRLKKLLSGADVKKTASYVSENVESTIKREPFSLQISKMVDDSLPVKKIIDYEDQLKFIDDTNIRSLVTGIPESSTKLDIDVSDALTDKILKNQDYLFTQLDSFEQAGIPQFYDFVIKNDKIIKELSDENIVRLLDNIGFADTNKQAILINEIYDRVSKGSKIFAMSTIENTFMPPFVYKDTSSAFKKLPPDLQDLIYNNYESLWKNVPDELKKYDFGNFYQNYHLAKLVDDGNITPNYVKIINSIYDENPNLLKTFNYDLLDKGIAEKLGIDYVKEMGRYDKLSVEIVSLYQKNPKLFDIFSDIVTNSKADDSLNTFYMKNKCVLDFIFQNASELNKMNDNALDVDNLMEYILYKNNSYSKNSSNKFIIDYTHDYLKKFYEECDLKYKEGFDSGNLDAMKNAYFNKYYSISIDDAKTFVARYYDHIPEVAKYDNFNGSISNFGTTVLEEIKYIAELENISELDNIYKNQKIRLSTDEMMAFDSHLKKMYSSSYVDALKKTRDKITFLIDQGKSSKVDYNGIEIDIIDLDDDFSFLVYSSNTGFSSGEKKLINDSYIDSWYSIDNPATHGLSTSYISDNNIGCCPVKGNGVLYAFDNINPENIAIMAPYDVDSNIANYGFSSGNKQIYISADNMSFNTTRVYNEIVLDRANVKPSAVIIYSNATKEEINNALKAASEWGIPVVRIDKMSLAKQQVSKINGLLDDFSRTKDLNSLKKAIDLYESNVSGYKLNAFDKMTTTDYTASINHDEVRELFSPFKIRDSISDYIAYIDNSSDKIEKAEELKDILETVAKRYEVANKNGTYAMPKTDSLLAMDGTIETINMYLSYWKTLQGR